MWKKGEMPDYEKPPQQATTSYDAPSPAPRSGGQAIIGRSIAIRGEVTGDEDLVIQGRVDGSVDLDQHAVTVGPEGVVKANITGRIVTVEGRVEGNVTGEEQVVLRKSSWVQGDIKAPRVVLEDGAHFRGGVLMGDELAPSRKAAPAPVVSDQKPQPTPTTTHATPAAQPAAAAAARSGTAKMAEAKG